jgi:hypothetical protein
MQIVRSHMKPISMGGILLSRPKLFMSTVLSVHWPFSVLEKTICFLLLLCLSHGKFMISDCSIGLIVSVGPVKEGACIV